MSHGYFVKALFDAPPRLYAFQILKNNVRDKTKANSRINKWTWTGKRLLIDKIVSPINSGFVIIIQDENRWNWCSLTLVPPFSSFSVSSHPWMGLKTQIAPIFLFATQTRSLACPEIQQHHHYQQLYSNIVELLEPFSLGSSGWPNGCLAGYPSFYDWVDPQADLPQAHVHRACFAFIGSSYKADYQRGT